ncbi:MAG: hypothetical protein KGL39_33655 [Patescibacteria group bacterium]|nr:hypothetical protein [Patescibacteria group bacterium]
MTTLNQIYLKASGTSSNLEINSGSGKDNPYGDSGCPMCGEHAISSCRCSGPHTKEQLAAGHGLACKNGHRFNNDGLAYNPETMEFWDSGNVAKASAPDSIEVDGELYVKANSEGESQNGPSLLIRAHWHIAKKGSKWHVLKADGTDEGESDTLAKAKAHMRALYANSPDTKASWQLSEKEGEPVFVQAWHPGANSFATKALGFGIRKVGIPVFKRATRFLNPHQSFGNSNKSFFASRRANSASQGVTDSASHKAAGSLHAQAARTAPSGDVRAYHQAMGGYHRNVASGMKASSEHIAEEKSAPTFANSHLEAAKIHIGLQNAHQKLGNTADAAFHASMADHHLAMHNAQMRSMTSASWQLDLSGNEPAFVKAELGTYSPRARQAGAQKRKFLSMAKKQYNFTAGNIEAQFRPEFEGLSDILKNNYLLERGMGSSHTQAINRINAEKAHKVASSEIAADLESHVQAAFSDPEHLAQLHEDLAESHENNCSQNRSVYSKLAGEAHRASEKVHNTDREEDHAEASRKHFAAASFADGRGNERAARSHLEYGKSHLRMSRCPVKASFQIEYHDGEPVFVKAGIGSRDYLDDPASRQRFHESMGRELDAKMFGKPKDAAEFKILKQRRDAHFKSANAYSEGTPQSHHAAWVAHQDVARKLNDASGGSLTHPYWGERMKHLEHVDEHKNSERILTPINQRRPQG